MQNGPWYPDTDSWHLSYGWIVFTTQFGGFNPKWKHNRDQQQSWVRFLSTSASVIAHLYKVHVYSATEINSKAGQDASYPSR